MRRAFTIVLLVVLSSAAALAQSSSASQTIELQLKPLIEISAVSNSSTMHLNGNSDAQKFRVRSNKSFIVTVNAASDKFSYKGTNAHAPALPVSQTLAFALANINNSDAHATRYESISASKPDVVLNGYRGTDETFAINYRTKQQNTKYPAGDYSVGVVYTATEL